MTEYRDKASIPDADAWGAFRSKMARRGVTQEWIDTYIDKRELMWGQHDHNVRSGYLGTDDVIVPPELVSILQLNAYLVDQGWGSEVDGDSVHVVDGAEEYVLAQIYLQSCDFSGLNNPPLENDVCMGLQEQGFCLSGCS